MVVDHIAAALPKIATAIPPPTTATKTGCNLMISMTDSIKSFLTSASTNLHLPEDLRDLSSSLVSSSAVPYTSLKSIWIASDRNTRPELSLLLPGCNFVFTSPKPREKSEELKARLRKLEEVAERKEYNELVKDITPRKGVKEPFSSYKDQLGFGLHVVVTMFTGYLVGYASFRALFSHSPALSAAGGILGLVLAMLVETFLFIIRASNQELHNSKSSPSTSTSTVKKNQ